VRFIKDPPRGIGSAIHFDRESPTSFFDGSSPELGYFPIGGGLGHSGSNSIGPVTTVITCCSSPGKQSGSYEIILSIGECEMGEAWDARAMWQNRISAL
jgi:hypothetical protein